MVLSAPTGLARRENRDGAVPTEGAKEEMDPVCLALLRQGGKSPFPNSAQGGFGVSWQVDHDEGKQDWDRKG